MRKSAYFEPFIGPGWPTPGQLKPFFLGTPERPSSFESDGDSWGLFAEGAEGTEHLEMGQGRIDIRLTMIGNPFHGVLLHHCKNGVGPPRFFYSKGDLRRLREWVQTKHGSIMPVGLFIPVEAAWRAVEEFIKRDGALPRSIEWIDSDDIPEHAFPDPGARAGDR